VTPPKAVLTIVGTPLSESGKLSAEAFAALAACQVVIGESRKVTFRLIKEDGKNPQRKVFLLDPPRKEEWEALSAALTELAKTGGQAALLSDTGMPILFDPGAEVLELARKLRFEIRSLPAATSWGAACAISGFAPPFHIVGFLPRENADRILALHQLKDLKAACLFMDTPYRYRLLLKQLTEVFGTARQAFLAWEIASAAEFFTWGSLATIEKESDLRQLQKGEFILITRPQ
jgi:16S rRNA (cytidine1402-2'-O)-methyltransferase